MQSITEVRAFPGRGLEGDRYFAGTGFYSQKSSYAGREVTLIEIEAVEALFGGVLNAAGERFGIKLAAADTRRDIVTSSVPLNHLVDREFWVGSVLMRGTRLCEPCKRLDDLKQHGVMRSLIHRGGLRAFILSEGVIRICDAVRPKTSQPFLCCEGHGACSCLTENCATREDLSSAVAISRRRRRRKATVLDTFRSRV